MGESIRLALGRGGLIVYECTSHPSNIKKTLTPYRFVANSFDMTSSILSWGLQNYLVKQSYYSGPYLFSRAHAKSHSQN